ncbi:MAG: SRPBCC family protein [Thermomicrobiales bacterium]
MTDTEIVVSQVLHATAGEVYQAFIDPAQYVIWGPTRFDNDPWIGGSFRQETDTDGFTSVVEGSYQHLIPDELIAMNWRFFRLGSDDIAKVTVSITIEPGVDSGTRITARESGPSISSTEPGDPYHQAWDKVFDALQTYLGKRTCDVHTMTRWFKAAPDRVFAAWTTAADLEIWLTKKASVELRIGGSYSLTTASDTGDHICFGDYRTIEPGSRLVKSWKYIGPGVDIPDGETRVDVRLRSIDATTTQMTFIESGTGLDQASYRIESSLAWNEAFRGLKELVEQ